MVRELFFEIFIAALAVFGLWCALRLGAEALLSSRQVGTVILISDAETAAHLDSLLEEVSLAPFRRRREALVVLYNAALCRTHGLPDAREQEMIAHAGGQWYMVDIKD